MTPDQVLEAEPKLHDLLDMVRFQATAASARTLSIRQTSGASITVPGDLVNFVLDRMIERQVDDLVALGLERASLLQSLGKQGDP